MLFLLLMPVFPQTLLAFVGSHLMPFSLFSAWHILLLNVRFNLCYESLGWFEGRDVVSGNNNGGILRNIPGRLLCAFLHNEAAKTSEINIIAGNHRVFY